MLESTVAILGCGNIGGALAQRLAGACKELRLFDSVAGKALDLELAKAKVCSSVVEAAENADLVVVALKPSGVLALLKEISDVIAAKTVIVSVAAGVTIDDLSGSLPEGQPVVRVMPNLAMAFGQGMTGIFSKDKNASEQTEQLFSLVGRTVELDEESQIDVITGVAGSGPAFIARAISGLKLAAEEAGIESTVSGEIAAQTALGAAITLLETGESPESLIERVTTPGGTTEKGLAVLATREFQQSMIEAVEAAILKAKQGMSDKEKS